MNRTVSLSEFFEITNEKKSQRISATKMHIDVHVSALECECGKMCKNNRISELIPLCNKTNQSNREAQKNIHNPTRMYSAISFALVFVGRHNYMPDWHLDRGPRPFPYRTAIISDKPQRSTNASVLSFLSPLLLFCCPSSKVLSPTFVRPAHRFDDA